MTAENNDSEFRPLKAGALLTTIVREQHRICPAPILQSLIRRSSHAAARPARRTATRADTGPRAGSLSQSNDSEFRALRAGALTTISILFYVLQLELTLQARIGLPGCRSLQKCC